MGEPVIVTSNGLKPIAEIINALVLSGTDKENPPSLPEMAPILDPFT